MAKRRTESPKTGDVLVKRAYFCQRRCMIENVDIFPAQTLICEAIRTATSETQFRVSQKQRQGEKGTLIRESLVKEGLLSSESHFLRRVDFEERLLRPLNLRWGFFEEIGPNGVALGTKTSVVKPHSPGLNELAFVRAPLAALTEDGISKGWTVNSYASAFEGRGPRLKIKRNSVAIYRTGDTDQEQFIKTSVKEIEIMGGVKWQDWVLVNTGILIFADYLETQRHTGIKHTFREYLAYVPAAPIFWLVGKSKGNRFGRPEKWSVDNPAVAIVIEDVQRRGREGQSLGEIAQNLKLSKDAKKALGVPRLTKSQVEYVLKKLV